MDVYTNQMAMHLKNIFEHAITEYQHTSTSKQFLTNMTKVTKRWKLFSVLRGKPIDTKLILISYNITNFQRF